MAHNTAMPTGELHNRLKLAREAAGYTNATEAAEARGWKVPTYLSHENGSRGVPRSKLGAYARAYGVTVDWLLTGRGRGPSLDGRDSLRTTKPRIARIMDLADQVNDIVGGDASNERRNSIADDLDDMIRRYQKETQQ